MSPVSRVNIALQETSEQSLKMKEAKFDKFVEAKTSGDAPIIKPMTNLV